MRGENGADKTTLLRTLVGLTRPERGELRWRGRDVHEQGEDYRRSFVYLGHPAALKDELSPLENLQLASRLDGLDPGEDELLDALQRLGLHGREDLPARVLSAGQRRRALLARLLLRRAELWVLDEPFTALDAAGSALLEQMLAQHLGTGGLAVLSSHQAPTLPGARELTI